MRLTGGEAPEGADVPSVPDALGADVDAGPFVAREAARARARVLLFGSAVLFGLSAVLVRLATRAGMNGGQVTLVRFAVGLAAVLSLFAARPGKFRPTRPWLLAARAFFGGVAALLYFMAIERIPAGEATLLNTTFPIWAVILSLFVLNERPTVHLGAALVLASAGVFLVLGGTRVSMGLGMGELLGILSGVCGGVAVTSIRALRASHTPALTVFFAFTIGGLAVSIPYGLGSWPTSAAAWAVAVGVGVSSFGAQIFMTEAYGALSVPEAALWQQLTPIATFLWALGIGEGVGWQAMLGVVLGVGGIFYGSILGHRPRDARSPEARLAAGIPAEEP